MNTFAELQLRTVRSLLRNDRHRTATSAARLIASSIRNGSDTLAPLIGEAIERMEAIVSRAAYRPRNSAMRALAGLRLAERALEELRR